MNALAKKLMIKPGKSWLFVNAPENYLALLDPLPEGVTINFEAKGKFDGIQLFASNSAKLIESLPGNTK